MESEKYSLRWYNEKKGIIFDDDELKSIPTKEEHKKERIKKLKKLEKEDIINKYVWIVEWLVKYIAGEVPSYKINTDKNSYHKLENDVIIPYFYSILRHRKLLQNDAKRFFGEKDENIIQRLKFENKKLVKSLGECHKILEKYYM